MALATPRAMTADLLLDAGYSRYHDPFSAAVLRHSYLGSYQLSFADAGGVRYTIAICHGFKLDGEPSTRGEYFCPEAQLKRAGVVFNVEMLWRGQGIAEVEGFFETMWRALDLEYAEPVKAAASGPHPGRN